MSASFLTKGSVVAITGSFKLLHVKDWIQSQGAKYVVWSTRITHIIVGSNSNEWKLANAPKTAKILYEKDILPTIASDLWVDRYRPKTLKEVIGHASQIADLTKWLSEFDPKKDQPRAALLTGPPGIGKTTVAHLVSRSAGYEVVEFNASDQRSAKQVNEVFDRAAKFGTIGKRRVIIMDEVDGMNAGDRGGVTEIAKFCRIVSFPIICIANERTSPKLRPLASCCLDIRFSRPTKTTIAKSLANSVVKTEKLRLSVADLERMCEESGNDIRSIVNSMQFSAQQEHQEAGKKDEMHRLDPFSATGRLFGQKGSLNDRMDCVYLDHNLVPLMVAEGYIQAADKGRGGDALERCVRAAEQISNWDMINTKIHTVQMWGLLPSATLAVVNASKSANGPAPFQIFPSWLGKNSKRLKHRRLVKELQTESGIKGEYGLCDTRNTLRTLLFNSELSSSQVVEKLHDLRMTRDNMLETLVETCFKDDEDSVKMDTKKKGAITREWKKTIPKFTTTIVAAESLTENDISDVNEIDESDDEDYIYS